jgi:hypothetical protein
MTNQKKGDMEANEFLHGKLYPERCWHEFARIYVEDEAEYCKHCKWIKIHPTKGELSNPTYSTMPIQDLIARLVEIGEWEKFGDYLRMQALAVRILSSTTTQPDKYYLAVETISQPRFANLMLGYWGWQGELFNEKQKGE